MNAGCLVDIEENSLNWTVEPKSDFKDLTAAQQLKVLKPTYTFEKVALTLQTCKGLVKNLYKVLCFLKSDKDYLVFSGLNGATTTFFVEILKDKNNFLSNLLNDECRTIGKEIHDYLTTSADKFEVYSGFRQQADSEELTLIYCKNLIFASGEMDMSMEKSSKKKKRKSNPLNLSKKQKKVQNNYNKIAMMSQPFIQTSLTKMLDFIKDSTQGSLVFNDLDAEHSKFISSISAKNWKSNMLSVLDPASKRLMLGIFDGLKAKKNWTISVCQTKVRENTLRDVIFEKKPNYGADTFREPNSLDILSADVLNRQPLPRDVRLKIDMSTPVVCNNALKIMKSMGWDGGSLGIRGNGITEPIMPYVSRAVRSGLGHQVKEQKPKKKYVPTLFIITVFERIMLTLLTKDGNEATLSSEKKMTNKDKLYLSHVVNNLNKREAMAVGDYGDKYTVIKILEVMNQDPSLRLIVYLYDDYKLKVIKARNLPSIPEYVPGSNIQQYVDTLITSFGSVFVIDMIKKYYMFEILTVLFELVLNDCESKTFIAPYSFPKKQMKFILNVVNHVNERKKCGGGKVQNFLFQNILKHVKGYFLSVDFDYVRSQQSPKEPAQGNLKNSFTLKKIYNKKIGIYTEYVLPLLVKNKTSNIQNKETSAEEKCEQELTDDEVTLTDSVSDESAIFDAISDTESGINELFDDEEHCNGKTESSSKAGNISTDKAKESLNKSKANKIETVTNSSATNNRLLLALDSNKTDMTSNSKAVIQEIKDSLVDAVKKVEISTQTGLAFDEKSTLPTNSCICKSVIDRTYADKETQTCGMVHCEENKVDVSIENNSGDLDGPSTSKSSIAEYNDISTISDEELKYYDSCEEYQDADSVAIDENTKYNSPDEWDQLEQDILNLRQVLENEFLKSVLEKAEKTEDNIENLKRYKADLEKFGSPNKSSFMKTIKIVPLNYPDESIEKKTIMKIHSLVMEAVSDNEQPLLKCNGVKNGALLYTCYNEDSYNFLNKLLIHTKTKMVNDDYCHRKPRLFMRFVNFLELGHKDVFTKLEMFNKDKGVTTKDWEVERCWYNNDFSVIVLQVDQVSFEIIKDNDFSLFFGVDQAEFSVVWR